MHSIQVVDGLTVRELRSLLEHFDPASRVKFYNSSGIYTINSIAQLDREIWLQELEEKKRG